MFDIGWTELMVIGIVALIVVGPKDLPGMFRTVGQYVGRARKMARDFQRAMEDAADESGMRGMASDLRKATDPKKMGLDAMGWDKPKPSAAKAATAKAASTSASSAGATAPAGAAAATRTPDDPGAVASAAAPAMPGPSDEELAEVDDPSASDPIDTTTADDTPADDRTGPAA